MDRNDGIVLAAFLGGMVAIVLAAAASHNGNGDLAQWVEALGVVGAIFGSARVATWQYRKGKDDEIRRAHDEKIRMVGDLCRLVLKIQTFLKGLPHWAMLGSKAQIPADDVTPDQAMVLSWLLYESDFGRLDDFGMIDVLADLRARLHRISEVLNTELEIPDFGRVQETRRMAAEISKGALMNCESFQDLARDYMLRGGRPE